MSESEFPISELVARTGVPAVTIHHYLAARVVPEPRRVARNRFLYDERHVQAVRLVRLLREQRNLPLPVIRRILPQLLQEGEEDAFRQQAWDVILAAEELPGERARTRLVETAIVMFSSPGYALVTIDEIADAAGIAKGSVYRYFPSKDALFFAAVRTCLDEVVAQFREGVRCRGDSVDVDTAAEILGVVALPAMPLLMDLAAQTLQGHAARLEVAQHVLDVLLVTVGSLTRGRGSRRERAVRVMQQVMAEAFRAVVPAEASS